MMNKNTMFYIFGVLMMFVYWGMACLLAFTSLFAGLMLPGFRYTLAVVFLIYGCFRAYRQFRRGTYR